MNYPLIEYREYLFGIDLGPKLDPSFMTDTSLIVQAPKLEFVMYRDRPHHYNTYVKPPPNATLQELKEAHKIALDNSTGYDYCNSNSYSSMQENPYPWIASELDDRIAAIECPAFAQSLTITHNDIINGYKLPQTINFNLMSRELFNRYDHLWKKCERLSLKNSNKDMTRRTFRRLAHKILDRYSEWGKIDIFGNYYSNEFYRNNDPLAYKKTIIENIEALYDLPYPKKVIIKMIKAVQSSGQYSVPYVNLYCHWLDLKRKQIAEYVSPGI